MVRCVTTRCRPAYPRPRIRPLLLAACASLLLSGCTRDERGLRCPPGSLLTACQVRCTSDGDCLAPARCNALTNTCQRPAILCDPLERPSAQEADGGTGLGSCPSNQECDLVSRICTPLPGAICGQDSDCRVGELCAGGACTPAGEARSCQRDADCPSPTVCRLSLRNGKLLSVCAAPLGPSDGGARCRTNTECQSGLCLRSGVCYSGCTFATAKADCHGHEGVSCGQVTLSVPAPAGGEAAAPLFVQSCTLPTPSCGSDRDCAELAGSCQVLVDAQQPSSLRTGCGRVLGSTRPGGPCKQDVDCATGLCQGTYCFTACRSSVDCPADFACRPASYRVDGIRSRIQSCVPAKSCTSGASCPAADDSCSPQPNVSEDGLELVCTPGRGRSAGQSCTLDVDCASGLCGERGLCIGGCSIDSDCPPSPAGPPELCRPLTATVRGVSGLIKACQVPAPLCRRDADCMAGAICKPYISLDDSTRIAPGCGPAAYPGKSPPGMSCISNADCRSGVCLMSAQPPVCYGVCTQDSDCAASRRCYPESTWSLTSGSPGQPSATYDATASCLPDVGSRRACSGDGSSTDCPAGELCALLPDARQVTFVKRCQRPWGSKLPGAPCAENKECQSNHCAAPVGGSSRLCIAPCSPSGPVLCGAGTGTSCKLGTLEVRPGKSTSLTYCQP